MKQIRPRGTMEWQLTVLLEGPTGRAYKAWLEEEGVPESVHVRNLIKSHLEYVELRKEAECG